MTPIYVNNRKILGTLSSDPGSNNTEGDVYFNSDSNKLRNYDGSAWANVDYDATATRATGGTTTTYTTSGDTWKVHTFTSNGTFTPTSALTNVQLLVLGGGGSGGASNQSDSSGSDASGGGGAGLLVFKAGKSLASGTAYAITIGNGGTAPSGANTIGGDGSESTFASGTGDAIRAGGGTGGGLANQLGGTPGSQGGSAGGAGGGGASVGTRSGATSNTLDSGTAYFNDGGDNPSGQGSPYSGSGGGGTGAQGVDFTGGAGTAGGDGVTSVANGGVTVTAADFKLWLDSASIGEVDGSNRHLGGGGGGGGGGNGATAGGAGGKGGGGRGSHGNNSTSATSGTANSGGGGGGAGGNTTSNGAGGSGVVIIRYI